MRRCWLAAMGIAVLLASPACKGKAPAALAATPIQQAAAMQLGFAAGSFLAQHAQPLELRKDSSAGYARSESDLLTFMGRLSINEGDAAGVTSALLDGFADPNPSRGSQLINQGMTLLMDRLSTSQSPELLWVFKVGASIGHMAETVNVLTQGTPQPEHAPAFAALTGKDRETLLEDLDRSGLPQELLDEIQAIPREVRGVSDIFALTRGCLKIRGMVQKLQ